MSNVAVAERPASVTLANGTVITSAMSVQERSDAVRQSLGVAPVARPTAAPQWHTPHTVARLEQGERELARAPREDGSAPAGIVLADKPAQDALGRWFTGLPANEQGTVKARYIAASRALQAGGWLEQTATGELIAHTKDEPRPGQHAGMIAPTPEALERGNSGNLAEFEAQMRAEGKMLPAPVEDGRFQRDPRTGHVVDTAALERCHELFRAITDPKERDAAREEYHQTLAAIYAGELQLADMEGSDAPRVEQPRDASGRFAPSQQPTTPQYTVKQMEEEHAKVADADGWIPLPRVGQWALSGYTLKQFIPNQRLNPAAFGMLANARKAGVSQAQVDAFLENQMRADGWIP